MRLDRSWEHYKKRSLKALTPEEQSLYLNSDKQQIAIEIMKEDHEFIKSRGLNMSRIVFFLVHEWLAKKRQELGE